MEVPPMVDDVVKSHLSKIIQEGEFCIIAGAGISVASGLPLWRELKELVRDEFPEGNYIDKIFSSEPADLIFQLNSIISNFKNRYKSKLAELFTEAEPSELHKELLRLKPSLIVTTNIDPLVSKAAELLNIQELVIRNTDPFRTTFQAKGKRIAVAHIHGRSDQRYDDWILDAEDYNRYLASKDTKDTFPEFVSEVRYQVSQMPILFVGFSMSDQTFLDNLMAPASIGSQPIFIICFDDQIELIEKKVADRFKYTVLPIRRTKQPEKNIIKLLAELNPKTYKKTEKKPRKTTGTKELVLDMGYSNNPIYLENHFPEKRIPGYLEGYDWGWWIFSSWLTRGSPKSEQIDITGIHDILILNAMIQHQIETRRTVFGKKLPGKLVTKEQFDVKIWDVGFSGPEDLRTESTTEMLGRGFNLTCEDCRGSGKVLCECYMSVKEQKPQPYLVELGDCEKCGGTQRVRCESCLGEGNFVAEIGVERELSTTQTVGYPFCIPFDLDGNPKGSSSELSSLVKMRRWDRPPLWSHIISPNAKLRKGRVETHFPKQMDKQIESYISSVCSWIPEAMKDSIAGKDELVHLFSKMTFTVQMVRLVFLNYKFFGFWGEQDFEGVVAIWDDGVCQVVDKRKI